MFSWLSIGSGVAFWNHSFCQRLRCSGLALCLWLGDNGVALSKVKRARQHYSNRLWAHTIFGQSNHWKVDPQLSVKLVVAQL